MFTMLTGQTAWNHRIYTIYLRELADIAQNVYQVETSPVNHKCEIYHLELSTNKLQPYSDSGILHSVHTEYSPLV